MTIENNAFRNCSNLTTVNFSSKSNIKTIKSYSFDGTAIKEVFLPNNVVDVQAFPKGVEIITYKE